MSAKSIEILVMEGIATLLFLFAYLIGVKGRMELIAGYNERTASRVKDQDGLKRLIARLCLLTGLASALMPLLTFLVGEQSRGMMYVIGGFGGFLLGLVALVMLQARDYCE